MIFKVRVEKFYIFFDPWFSSEIANSENAADNEILKNDDSENTADSDYDENEEFVDDDFLEM